MLDLITRIRQIPTVAFVLAVIAVVSMKMASYSSFEAGIMPDEYRYMIASFSPDSAQSDYGNYLFTAVYSSALNCGEAWYQCVKGINVAFEFGAVFLLAVTIYLATKSLRLASLGLGLTLVGPFNLFGGYFMPEAMHNFLFFLAFLVVVVTVKRSNLLWALLPGLALSLAMLTKPHSISIAALSTVLGLLLVFVPQWQYQRRLGWYALLMGISAVVFRIVGGFAFAGSAGLNPFASYFSLSGFVSAISETDGGSAASQSQTDGVQRYIEAVVAAITNIMPALAVLILFSILISRLSESGTWTTLSDRSNVMALVFFMGPVLLSSAFGALLELRSAEETIFRTMTRYWEFAIPLLFFVLIVSLSKDQVSNLGAEGTKVGVAFKTIVILLGLSIGSYLWLIPRQQTMSDTSLVEDNYQLFSLVFIATLLIVLFIPARQGQLMLVAPVAFIISLSLVSVSQMLSFTTEEKSGAAGGRYVLEKTKIYPSDSDRVAFVGDRVASFVGAFTAKLPNAQILTTDPYSTTQFEDLQNAPRWVVASPEIYIEGPHVSKTVVGDSVIYEFLYPSPIAGYELQKYGFDSSSELQETFWGAWVEGDMTTITVPSSISGKVLQLNLVANSDLDYKRIRVSFDGETAEGDLLELQEVTPVSLRRPDGSDWSGASVTISYLGDSKEANSSVKGFAFGIDSISVFNVQE